MSKRSSKKATLARTLSLGEFTSWQFVASALPYDQEVWDRAAYAKLRRTAYAVRGDVRRYCVRKSNPDMTVGEFVDELHGRRPSRILNSRKGKACDDMLERLFTRFDIMVNPTNPSGFSEAANTLLEL